MLQDKKDIPMLSRRAKAAFYFVAGPLMWVNGILYRRFRAPRSGDVKVHLGPGKRKYIDGWVNVDANTFTARCDVWADLRNPLPFNDATIQAFYSYHMIEHLPDIFAHLVDAYRCLKPGGKYRFGGPSGDAAIQKFLENDEDWFYGPDAHNRSSIGGKFESFVCCRGEHLSILTYSMLEEFLLDIGYVNIRLCSPVNETSDVELFTDCLLTETETDPATPHSLIIEAQKPQIP